MWGSHIGMGWWMVLGSVWMVILWGFIIWALASFVGKLTGNYSGKNEDPMETARRRLASGEITKEQFDEIKQRLS